MLNSFRNIRTMAVAKSAGVIGIATILGAGVAAADQIQVKVNSVLTGTFIVNFTGGGISLKDHEVPSGGSALPLAKATDGATITWVGRPKKPDESKFAECSGSATVTAKDPTITLKAQTCKDKTAATAPKAAAPKTGANSSAPARAPHMEVTFTNAMTIDIQSLRIYDRGEGDTPTDETQENIGAQQGHRFSAIKGKDGKYKLEVTLQCNGSSHTFVYHDSETTLRVEKYPDNSGCHVANVKQ
jgi:hypothetical protein